MTARCQKTLVSSLVMLCFFAFLPSVSFSACEKHAQLDLGQLTHSAKSKAFQRLVMKWSLAAMSVCLGSLSWGYYTIKTWIPSNGPQHEFQHFKSLLHFKTNVLKWSQKIWEHSGCATCCFLWGLHRSIHLGTKTFSSHFILTIRN